MNKIEFSLEERAFMEEVPTFVNKYGVDHTCLIYNLAFNTTLDQVEFRDRFRQYKTWRENRMAQANEFIDMMYSAFETPVEVLLDTVRKMAAENAQPVEEPKQQERYTRILL